MSVLRHPLMNFSNELKQQLMAGDVKLGIFLVSASSTIAECCATRAIDWLIVDMEASAADRRELTQVLQALNGSQTAGMVRVTRNERHAIEAALDAGAYGLLVPKVDDASQAKDVVNSAYYPPLGKRGVNPIRCSGYFSDLPTYFKRANDLLLCMVQIESAEAVSNAEEIAATPGIDALFIGCGDLACDLGQPGNVVGPRMDEARARVMAACQAHNKIPGIFAYSRELAIEYMKEGFRFVAVGNDIKFLAAALENDLLVLHAARSSC